MEHILLLHGALGAASTLKPLQQALQAYYNVHTVNFSGHGGQEIPVADFSIDLFAQDVLTYINRQELQQVHIFGYSMGGYVALYLASQHPYRIKTIFTLATKFDWSPATAEKELKLLNPEKIIEKVPHFAHTLAERHNPQNWKEIMTKTAVMMQQLGKQPVLTAEIMNQIQVRVQVGVGDNDTMVSLEETLFAFRNLPLASLLVLPATIHPIESVSVHRLLYEVQSFIDHVSNS